MSCLPHQPNRLQPAEDLFDSFSLPLAESEAFMPSRASIDRATALLWCDVRRDTQISQAPYETPYVETFVRSHRHAPTTRDLGSHRQSRLSLRVARCLRELRIDRQPIAILHQQVTREAQLRG